MGACYSSEPLDKIEEIVFDLEDILTRVITHHKECQNPDLEVLRELEYMLRKVKSYKLVVLAL